VAIGSTCWRPRCSPLSRWFLLVLPLDELISHGVKTVLDL
jgi:hypothetical protein